MHWDLESRIEIDVEMSIDFNENYINIVILMLYASIILWRNNLHSLIDKNLSFLVTRLFSVKSSIQLVIFTTGTLRPVHVLQL